MGFDIYGTNPRNPKNLEKPKLDWSKETTEEEKKKYFKDMEYYEETVKGYYFRNNVWWWRPLANAIVLYNDWLTEKQIEHLSYNDGFEFSDEEAEKIRNSLLKRLEDGTFKKMEDEWKKKAKVAEKWNTKVEKEMEKLGVLAEKELGKKDVAPMDFPPKIKEKWDKLYETKDRTCMYPFSVANIKRFCLFLKDCGGFKVC